jgi:hypothetical protein
MTPMALEVTNRLAIRFELNETEQGQLTREQ